MLNRLSDAHLQSAGISTSAIFSDLHETQQRKLVKLCAQHNCYEITNHADERQHERGITATQLLNCMKLGILKAVELGNNAGELKFVLQWRDQKERKDVNVVVVLWSIRGPALLITSNLIFVSC